jgi:signal peptidase II
VPGTFGLSKRCLAPFTKLDLYQVPKHTAFDSLKRRMKLRDWLVVIFPLVVVWVLDRYTKNWASGLTGISSLGPFHFALHHNHGAMLGLFSDLPSVLRVVTLSTGGAFLLCTYAIIQYMLPIRSMLLRTGLSILIGGILGNVADRIIWGYVVDFIVIGFPSLSSPAFNIADAVQWIGYLMIITAIVREGDLLWPENSARQNYWVNRKFQLKYSFFLSGVIVACGIIGCVFSYTYFRVTITELVGNNQYLLNKFLVPFVITFILIFLTMGLILFALGKYLSHRIAGPLYAFEKALKDILDGDTEKVLKLRAGDEFKHLENLTNQVRKKVQKIKNE